MIFNNKKSSHGEMRRLLYPDNFLKIIEFQLQS